jgi:hypothetical protein
MTYAKISDLSPTAGLVGTHKIEVESAKYYPIFPGISASTVGIGSNYAYMSPFVVPKDVTIDRIGGRVVTANGTGSNNWGIGVYAANMTSLKPTGNVLFTSSNMATSVATSTFGTLNTTTYTLVAGTLYFAVINSDASPAILSATVGYRGHEWIAGTVNGSTLDGSGASSSFNMSLTFGSWPDLTSVTPSGGSGSGSPILLYFRVA